MRKKNNPMLKWERTLILRRPLLQKRHLHVHMMLRLHQLMEAQMRQCLRARLLAHLPHRSQRC